MVSSDGHIGAPHEAYKDYLEAQYLDEYQAWIAGHRASEEHLRSSGFANTEMTGRRRPYVAQDPAEGLTVAEVCDPVKRTETLETEGVVAEVLFPGPDFARELGFPFGSSGSISNNMGSATLFSADPSVRDLELSTAGQRAYNRWLADYCAQVPGRTVGLMHPPMHNLAAATSEIRWAREAGLRGVQMASDDPRFPPYWDEHWEPFWRVCEETQMPIHFHGGTSHSPEKGIPDGNDLVRSQVLAVEGPFWYARPLKVLIYSGVMERHPDLHFVFTEFSSDWVPNVLARMEWFYNDASLKTSNPTLVPRPPSEYWYRQCHVGASLLSRDEVLLRHQIGEKNMMFGVDFPHPEGSWGRTSEWLQQVFGSTGTSEGDLRRILGLNAVELYGLDLSELQPIADRVGPDAEQILEALPRPRLDWGDKFAYSPSPYRPAGWSPTHSIESAGHFAAGG